MMSSRNVYFLSNRTAITAETLGKSLLAQFPDVEFSVVTIPYIDSIQKAESIVKRINLESHQTVLKPMVISTLADESISQIIHQSDALVLDLLSAFCRIWKACLISIRRTRQDFHIVFRINVHMNHVSMLSNFR